MTYEEAQQKLGISMLEASFNVAVLIFDKRFGECAKAKGIYDDALSLFLLHRDVLGDGATSGGSQSVGSVSITDGTSTGTSNYEKDLIELLKSVGCLSAKRGIGAYSSRVFDAC